MELQAHSDAEIDPLGTDSQSPRISMFKIQGLLDRFLAVWVLLAIAIVILGGHFVLNAGPGIRKGIFVGVCIPIAVRLLVKTYPILYRVIHKTIHHILRERKIWLQIGFRIIVNWIVAPSVMLGLAWPFLPDKPSLRHGLFLIGLARYIAIVLIWTDLISGDNGYCAILVINSMLQLVLFAPLANQFLRFISGTKAEISYEIVAKSVAVFLGIPLGVATVIRFGLRKLVNPASLDEAFSRFVIS